MTPFETLMVLRVYVVIEVIAEFTISSLPE
jgi:hypothetical protein